MKALLIVNPRAGRGRAGDVAPRVADLLTQSGMEVTSIATTQSGHAREIAGRDGRRFDLVVCAGGDGTLNEVASGLMTMENRPRLGYIPAGTTNDVAYGLGLPTNALQAGRVIVRGDVHPFDIGRFGERVFVYSASFGVFSDVPYATSQAKKNRIGRIAYITEGAARLGSVRAYSVRVEHDAGNIEGKFVFCSVSNTERLGGLVRLDGRDVAPNDGLFEVLLVRETPNPMVLIQVFFGMTMGKFDARYVEFLHTSHVKITCDEEIHWCIDGEDGGLHRAVAIENEKQTMDIIA